MWFTEPGSAPVNFRLPPDLHLVRPTSVLLTIHILVLQHKYMTDSVVCQRSRLLNTSSWMVLLLRWSVAYSAFGFTWPVSGLALARRATDQILLECSQAMQLYAGVTDMLMLYLFNTEREIDNRVGKHWWCSSSTVARLRQSYHFCIFIL